MRLLIVATLTSAGLFAAEIASEIAGPVVHEWGTFTSVADEDGMPVSWLPLAGTSDLPCFVYRLGDRNFKQAFATVRMETPVLYFYVPHPMTFSVHVDFPKGLITEWYPNADHVAGLNRAGGQIDWFRVEASPGPHAAFPVEKGASHYYAARNTDSVPLRVGQQQDKMIFYRGLGDIRLPVETQVGATGKVSIRNQGYEPIPVTILFENHGGKTGYRMVRGLMGPTELDPPELGGNMTALERDMEDALTGMGLYKKEAQAMIATWRDSWFEEGVRVFYVVPRTTVDSGLPLAITPAPATTVRVFVGRSELLSAWMEKEIVAALADGDAPMLEKYGRFLSPFMDQIQRVRGNLTTSKGTRAFLNAAYQRINREFQSRACGE